MLAPSLDALDALVAEFNSGDVKQQEAAALQICALSIDPSNHEKIISRSEMFGALLVELGVSSGRAEIREIAVRLILNLLHEESNCKKIVDYSGMLDALLEAAKVAPYRGQVIPRLAVEAIYKLSCLQVSREVLAKKLGVFDSLLVSSNSFDAEAKKWAVGAIANLLLEEDIRKKVGASLIMCGVLRAASMFPDVETKKWAVMAIYHLCFEPSNRKKIKAYPGMRKALENALESDDVETKIIAAAVMREVHPFYKALMDVDFYLREWSVPLDGKSLAKKAHFTQALSEIKSAGELSKKTLQSAPGGSLVSQDYINKFQAVNESLRDVALLTRKKLAQMFYPDPIKTYAASVAGVSSVFYGSHIDPSGENPAVFDARTNRL